MIAERVDGFPMAHLLLQLRRPPEQETALEQFLDELQDPASPNFHKWLTPEQFGQELWRSAARPRYDHAVASVAWLHRELDLSRAEC